MVTTYRTERRGLTLDAHRCGGGAGHRVHVRLLLGGRVFCLDL